MNRVEKISIDCAEGNFQSLFHDSTQFDQSLNFNEYFQNNDFNVVFVDKAVGGNSLFFTLMYVKNKLNWKDIIPKLDETKYRNLSFLLQKAYRKNPYHNQVHAADIVQNIYFMLFKQDAIGLC